MYALAVPLKFLLRLILTGWNPFGYILDASYVMLWAVQSLQNHSDLKHP